jgi:Ca-activated chloride channel family protein
VSNAVPETVDAPRGMLKEYLPQTQPTPSQPADTTPQTPPAKPQNGRTQTAPAHAKLRDEFKREQALGKEKDDQMQEVVVTGEHGAPSASMEVRQSVGTIDETSAEGTVQTRSVIGVGYSEQQNFVEVKKGIAGAVTAPQEYEGHDKFQHFDVNPVKRVADEPVSTFSADVDTASYSFVRRLLNNGVLPQKDAVRVEEMVNYFSYSWPLPESRKEPFRPTVVVSDSPWGHGKKLVHIGIKGYEMPPSEQPDSNLVLLLDVSGSMSSPDRLPLAIESMKLLLGSLKPTDTVAIVVYAGEAGLVLEPTAVREKQKIVDALDNLHAGGSTAGAQGIKLAYQLAESHMRKGGVNRILLATDGDFNVGIDSTEELKGYVERQREKGVFLSVLGFGQGNYRDEMAQALAQNGNGVAAYIDTLAEARKVLVQEATGSLFTIAKDVKLQVEFNPDTVAEYRLVGYETRALKREDFNNDAVDAGDVGAGHTVTAIYEITPVDSGAALIDESRYASRAKPDKPQVKGAEYGFLKIRYKLPDGKESKLLMQPIAMQMPAASAQVRRDVAFSTAVAGFAQLLRGGTYTGKLNYDDVIEDAQAAIGEDANGYRAEFVQLVRKARGAKGM